MTNKDIDPNPMFFGDLGGMISGEWEPNYIKQEIDKIISEIEEETYNVVIDELIKANYQ